MMSLKPVLLHFKYDGFADLTTEVNSSVESDVQTDCNGNKWYLELYPGGEDYTAKEGWVGLYLWNDNRDFPSTTLDAKFSLAVKDADGATHCETHENHSALPGDCCTGSAIYMKRTVILNPSNNILRDGALCIDVTIQFRDKKHEHYHPKNKLAKKMMKLLESGERSDASFKVGDRIFPVHTNILHNNAPILANHLDQDQTSEFIIEGISSSVFWMVLAYVYAEQYPSDEKLLKYGKEIIDAANKYELPDLKMAVEHVLVRERILTTKNVCDYILFADAKSCPFLKEYAITFLRANAKEVLQSDHSLRLRESSELLTEVVVLSNEVDDTLNVNELRKELGKRKLDVDGSKEILLSRLEEANKRQRTE